MSLSMVALSPVSIGCQKKVNYTILWGDAGTSKTRSTGDRSWWCWNSQWDQQVISICPQNNIDFSLLISHMLQWLTVRSAVVWCKFSLWELLLYSWHSSKSWLYNFCSDIFVSNVQMHLLWRWCVSQQVYTSSKLLTIHTSIQLHFDVYKSRNDVSVAFIFYGISFWYIDFKSSELFFSCTDCQSSCLHCP